MWGSLCEAMHPALTRPTKVLPTALPCPTMMLLQPGQLLCCSTLTPALTCKHSLLPPGHVTFFWNGNRSGYFDEELETYVEVS